MAFLSLIAIVRTTLAPNTHRRAMFVMGLLSPIIIPVSVLLAFLRRDELPCPAHLERLEQQIEEKRFQIFGGKRSRSFMASAWQRTYQEYLRRSASKIQDIVEHRHAA
jgi:hypothetical protein